MKRARAPEQKAARRQALLSAAARCFVDNNHQLPSAAQVAEAAQVAKGTVYLYFSTKEAIFLGLLGEHLQQLLSAIRQPVREESIARRLTARVLDYIEAEPSFLPLSAQLQGTLQQNLDQPMLMEFKRQLAQNLIDSGHWLDQTYKLQAGTGSRSLLHCYAAMVGLWQLLQWPPVLADQAESPDFEVLRRQFGDEIQWSFERIWSTTPRQ
ncbi:TetR family transcriptional regulator [Saccharospirillum sp. HFRX-1]|uniref:TetR family transcriptional regulator n=1 Tax=unclassified Saccharospirillum TaxID=2633430 RepID=UPI00371DA92C